MEREIRKSVEEVNAWKIKANMERENREATDRKIQDPEGEIAVMKETMRETKKEGEREKRIWEEMRDRVRKSENGSRSEGRRREREDEKNKIKREVKVVKNIKRKSKEGGRIKVWERGLIMHKEKGMS